VSDQIEAVDAQVVQHDGLGPLADCINSAKLDPGEFNQVHAFAWPTGRSARFCSHPGEKTPMHSLLCLQVAITVSHGSSFVPHPSKGVAPLLVVGTFLQWDHRPERNPLIRLYHKQNWVVFGQVQREFDIARRLQNNSLRHV
jgi:hypothetical protein